MSTWLAECLLAFFDRINLLIYLFIYLFIYLLERTTMEAINTLHTANRHKRLGLIDSHVQRKRQTEQSKTKKEN